jgi:hypothetical protein
LKREHQLALISKEKTWPMGYYLSIDQSILMDSADRSLAWSWHIGKAQRSAKDLIHLTSLAASGSLQ